MSFEGTSASAPAGLVLQPTASDAGSVGKFMNRVGVLGIGLGVGMALGTFFGRLTAGHFSDTAFDALGNWLAAIGTVGAVIVALLVAQREVLERARDRDAAVMREYLSATRAADEREARARAKKQEIDDLRAKEERDALSVECWARWGSTIGVGSAPDTVDLTSFRATVKNPTLVDLTFVEIRHPLFGIASR
jgi:hypothetical protein